MNDLIIHDYGDNPKTEIILNNEKIDLTSVTGYKLIRRSGEPSTLIIEYDVKIRELIIKNKESSVKYQALNK